MKITLKKNVTVTLLCLNVGRRGGRGRRGGGLNKIYMGESYQDFLKCVFVGVGGEKGVLGSLSHNNFFSPKICNLTLPLQLCTKEYSLPRKFCQKYFKRKQTLSQNI